MSSKHSKYSPSGSKRWMNCPGSIKLSESCPPSKGSVYALEGTAAHELCEKCLLKNKMPIQFLGEPIVIEEDGKEHTFYVNADMVEAAEVYVEYILELVERNDIPSDCTFIEERFELPALEIFGTSDFSAYSSTEKTVFVVDYKHGVGIEVYPDNNTQLMIYACGAINEILKAKPGIKIENVELTIVQPRIAGDDKIKTWAISMSDLTKWAKTELAPAVEATKKAGALLNPGSHCRFCPAHAVCPAQQENAALALKSDFAEPITELPSPAILTDEQIAEVLDRIDTARDWFKEVEIYAQNKMEMGVHFPGRKLVYKRSTRRWIDESSAEAELKAQLGNNAYEMKLLSVAKAEKALKPLFKSLGIDTKQYLSNLSEKPEPGITMVAESDRRERIIPQAAMDFLSTADFMQ